MTATELLHALAASGARLTIADGRLSVRAAKGALSDEIKAAMRDHRPALLRIVSRTSRAGAAVSACWLCSAPWKTGWLACPSCRAIVPGLSEADADTLIYGPGAWV
jgi:hypothetical protein